MGNEEEIEKLKNQLEQASQNVNIEKKEFSEIEQNAEKRFNENISGYVRHKNYENLKPYLEIVTSKDTKINCLVIKGEQGIGKSSVIKSLMKEMGKDIYYINSYSTALSFYKTLYHNRFKHIIIDDVFGLFNDEKGIAILRAITNSEKSRYVKYQSTSDKLDVPSSMIFEGSVTILTNHITDKMDESLLDRAIYREVSFTLNDKIEMSREVINFNYKELEKEQVEELVSFIKDNVDETTKNFSFRTILRICEFYKTCKEKWKEMALVELSKDEELVLVKNLINKHNEAKKQVDEFVNLTGKSRRTFFNIKKRLVQECKSAENMPFKNS